MDEGLGVGGGDGEEVAGVEAVLGDGGGDGGEGDRGAETRKSGGGSVPCFTTFVKLVTSETVSKVHEIHPRLAVVHRGTAAALGPTPVAPSTAGLRIHQGLEDGLGTDHYVLDVR